MITEEQLYDIINDEDADVYTAKDRDFKAFAIALLRERIPYDVCPSIIGGSGYETAYLVEQEIAAQYLSETDARILKDCGVFINEGSLAIYL